MDFGWSCYTQKRLHPRHDTEVWKFWNNKKPFCEYILSKVKPKTALYIFAHNVFFDLQVSDFFYWFTKWGWVLDFYYAKELTYILVIRKDKQTIKCLSTTNYFPYSLKKLGKLIGLEKIDVDFETTPRSDLIDYCKRDVEIIKAAVEYWIAFIDKHDLGNFTMTKASQAFTGYRHRFMDTNICLHKDEELAEKERKAYYGGRVECFEIGNIKGGPFVSLDINSMYPFVMNLFKYPIRYVDTLVYPDNDRVKEILTRRLCVAEVQLDTDVSAYAKRHNNKIIFPTGRFSTYLCSEGLKFALSRGHVKNIKWLLIYEGGQIFKDYVKYFYSLRLKYKKDKNQIMTQITKDLLNSLYGKFGQKKPLIDSTDDLTCDGYYREEIADLVTGQTEVITKLFNKRFIEWGSESAPTSFVAIAAHVTEYARFHLWKIINDIGIQRVLYCDTDSIKIRKKDLKYLTYEIDSAKLGALKIEDTFKTLEISGAKHYETEKERVVKGVPLNAKRINHNTWEYLSFPGQDTHLRQKVTRYFIVQPVKKVMKRNYDKGQVLPNGKVRPFHFSEF